MSGRADVPAEPLIRDGRIGWPEAAAILFMSEVMKAFLAFPERMAKGAMTAAWVVPIASALLSAVWIAAMVALLKRYPGLNLIDVSKKLAGRTVGALLGIAFFAYSAGLCAACAYQIGSALISTYLPRTPLSFLLILGFALGAYVAASGTEVVGRLCVVWGIFTACSVLLLVLLTIPSWGTEQFYPLLGPGVGALAKTAFVRQAVYSEIMVLGVIAAYIRKPRDIGRAAIWGTVASAVMLTVVVIAAHMVLTYPRLIQQSASLLRVARRVYLGRFFQRFDSLFVLIWLGSGVVRMGLGVYAGSIALASAFGLRAYRPLTPLVALATLVCASLIPDTSTSVIIDFDILRPYGVILIMGWPLAMFALSRLRPRRRRP